MTTLRQVRRIAAQTRRDWDEWKDNQRRDAETDALKALAKLAEAKANAGPSADGGMGGAG